MNGRKITISVSAREAKSITALAAQQGKSLSELLSFMILIAILRRGAIQSIDYPVHNGMRVFKEW